MMRNKFSLSHYRLFTGDMGELIPCGLTEVLPGDTVQQATSVLLRVSPLVAPVMHPVHVKVHHWYVPHRLVWEDFEDFITGGPDGNDASVFPTITAPGVGGFAVGTLADYLGCPTAVNSLQVSALPFRGYSLIWNEWYRDQDLETPLTVSKASGADSTTNTTLQNGAWEKDYFTMARPWLQKGDAVSLPLGTLAPVNYGAPIAGTNYQGKFVVASQSASTADWGQGTTLGTNSGNIADGSTANIYADLSAATAASINDLREAFALQTYKENRARYGSRFTEYLAAAFGVRSSDARLQRPEYLGGGRQVIQFSEVLQTAPTTGGSSTGVGALAGHGIGAVRSNRYRRFFEEHGYIFTFIQVQPKTMYAQGLARHWNRRIKEDFFQRELQFIGQQEVLNKEIYAAHASPDGVFGYADRYDEYRRSESGVSGEFRTTLDYWHMARLFGSSPALNASFVKSNPTKRVNQVQSADVLWIMANHSIQARRIVSNSATPRIM